MAANPVEPNLALHESLPDLLRNLLWNPVEPDLALHQSLPEPPEPSPEPSLGPCWTWPGSAPKPPRPDLHRNLFRSPPARIPEITWRKPSRHNSSHIVTSKQTTTKPCRNESGEKKGETDSETWADVRNDEGAPTTHRARSESAQ